MARGRAPKVMWPEDKPIPRCFWCWTMQQRSGVFWQINRDSMVEVPVLHDGHGALYTWYSRSVWHIAYGDGRNRAAKTMCAVSMMLDDQPINGHLSLNMAVWDPGGS